MHKFFCFFRICEMRIFFTDDNIFFYAAELSEFSFHGNTFGVCGIEGANGGDERLDDFLDGEWLLLVLSFGQGGGELAEGEAGVLL